MFAYNIAGKMFLRRVLKLRVEICIAPNFPIRGNEWYNQWRDRDTFILNNAA